MKQDSSSPDLPFISMDSSASVPLEILHYPHPFLNRKAREVKGEELKSGKAGDWILTELVGRMLATMYGAEGLGLAAPQVKVSLRLWVADISEGRKEPFCLINPVLSDGQGEMEEEEGCLSLPGIRAKVRRSLSLKVSGFDLAGKPVSFGAEGLLSRVCQHETDHLDGTLILRRIGMASRFMLRRKITSLEEDFEVSSRKRRGKG